MNLDDPICLCFRVSRRKIISYLRIHQSRFASQLSECGGAGTGCGWCIPILQQLFARSQNQPIDLNLDQLDFQQYQQDRGVYLTLKSNRENKRDNELPEQEEQNST